MALLGMESSQDMLLAMDTCAAFGAYPPAKSYRIRQAAFTNHQPGGLLAVGVAS